MKRNFLVGTFAILKTSIGIRCHRSVKSNTRTEANGGCLVKRIKMNYERSLFGMKISDADSLKPCSRDFSRAE